MRRKFFLFLLLFFACERFCYLQTAGFTPSKIEAKNTTQASPLPSELEQKLSHPLRFLGSGKQFYAFESAEGEIVLKFVKQSRRKRLPWLEKLPLPTPLSTWRDEYVQKRERRLTSLLNSCQLAYTHLSQESGLLYAQLGAQSGVRKEVILIDKLGIHHTLDLNKTAFVIQKKIGPLNFTKESIQAIFALTYSQCKKGVSNADALITRNYGLIGTNATLLDCGSLFYKEKLKNSPFLEQELLLELLSLREHLQNYYPHLVKHFDETYQSYL